MCVFVILVVYICLVSVKHWSPMAEKWADPMYLVLAERGGFLSFSSFSSGTDFHGKAALINMALKPGTFYFVHKDHCKAFKFLLHTVASAI